MSLYLFLVSLTPLGDLIVKMKQYLVSWISLQTVKTARILNWHRYMVIILTCTDAQCMCLDGNN